MSKIKIGNEPFGPFPVAIVGADVKHKPSFTTVGACGVVSQEPVLYVSLKNTHYINSGIIENGFFSLNYPSPDIVKQTDFCGIASGHSTDKAGVFNSFYDVSGRAPMIAACPVNVLCRVIDCRPIFNFDFFLGKIIAVYCDESCQENGKLDPRKMNPMVLMGPAYWNLGRQVGRAFHDGLSVKSHPADTFG